MQKATQEQQVIEVLRNAGGEVGLHIATLVVTKESETEDGKSAHGDF